MSEVQVIDGCGCMYDAGGRPFRSRCICPPEPTPNETLRAVAGLGGSIGDAVAGLLAENERLRVVADAAEALRRAPVRGTKRATARNRLYAALDTINRPINDP